MGGGGNKLKSRSGGNALQILVGGGVVRETIHSGIFVVLNITHTASFQRP